MLSLKIKGYFLYLSVKNAQKILKFESTQFPERLKTLKLIDENTARIFLELSVLFFNIFIYFYMFYNNYNFFITLLYNI